MKITIILGKQNTNKTAKAVELIGWKNCHWLTPANSNELLMTTRVVIDEVTEFKQLERFLKLKYSLTELIIISSTMQESDFKFTPLIYEEVNFVIMDNEIKKQPSEMDYVFIVALALFIIFSTYYYLRICA
jgi:hypothetical protein